jgi:hypothetical protein
MMRTPLLAIAALMCVAFGYSTALRAQPTWSGSVAPIIYSKCGSCHVDGGIAPFPLTSYESVVAMNAPIQFALGRRTMPPWPPRDTEQRLAHSRALTQQELATIEAWITADMPRGNANAEPAPPRSLRSTQLPSAPEFTARIPTYTSTASTRDVYQYFVLPTSFSTDRFIRAFEVMPGNPEIVHHALVFVDTTGTARSRDAQTPEPGFGGFGGDAGDLVAAWAPGSPPVVLPSNFGLRLPAMADLVIQIHYPAGTAGRIDSTRLNLLFADGGSIRTVSIAPILNHTTPSLLTPPFVLPPNVVTTMRNSFTIPFGTFSLLSVAPHMHLIGKSIKAVAVSPQADTTTLIDIPEWDFHWQGSYLYKKPIVIRTGTTLHGTAVYDNTGHNPHNPSSPPRTVRLGEATTDEMFLVYFMYTTYRNGDENLDLEALTAPTSVQEQYAQTDLGVTPNPASTSFMFDGQGAPAYLSDALGRVLRTMPPSWERQAMDVADLPGGVYALLCGQRRSMVYIGR